MIEGVLCKYILNNTSANAVAVRAALASYQGVKCVFSGEIPPNAAFPALVVQEVGGPDFGCRGYTGGSLQVDVGIWSNKLNEEKTLRTLAKNTWNLLNRSTLAPYLAQAGFEDWGCFGPPPRRLVGENGFPGYVLSLTVRVLQ